MKIRFDPTSKTLTIYSNAAGIGRTIPLNKNETTLIATAGNPRVVPRIDTLLRQLRALETAALPDATIIRESVQPRTDAHVVVTYTPNTVTTCRTRIDPRTGHKTTTTTTRTIIRTVQRPKSVRKDRRRRGSAEERFWMYVERRGPNECWPWIGSMSGKYGQLSLGVGHTTTAHRLSYELHHRTTLTSDQIVRHQPKPICGNHACVNPAHLFIKLRKANEWQRPATTKHATTS